MSRYKPYPAYKNSGVEWLGQVPEHWEVKPLRWISLYRNSNIDKKSYNGQRSIRLCNYTDVYYNEFIRNSINFMSATASDDEIKTMSLAEGDIIITKDSEDPSDIGIPALVAEELKGVVCGYHLTVIKAPKKLSRFLHRAIQATPSKAQFYVKAPGITRFGLSQDAIGGLYVALPSDYEYNLIADHLDRETTRIEALIKNKTRFIELLREKRQALITQAVTKGLSPGVKLKDSGVEWLGQVPEHWEIKRIAAVYREVARVGQDGLPILSISIHSGISDDELSSEERDRKVLLIDDREKYKRVESNDLAYNMMRAWQGAFGAVRVDGLVSPAYVVAEPRIKLISTYVELLLRTSMAIEEMRRFSRGIADFRMRLYWEYFRDIKIVLPPLEEQERILAEIESETTRIFTLITKTQQSIDLLKERRSALITAAVTGQIDLREVPHEPDPS